MKMKSLLIGLIFFAALLIFQLFNYSITEVVLITLIGDIGLLGVSCTTILSVAFCAIDFIAVVHLFDPNQEENDSAKVWYLFSAWLLAATINAGLIWWGLSITTLNQVTPTNTGFINAVPISVALLSWVVRIFIIVVISIATSPKPPEKKEFTKYRLQKTD
jgi:hypothetical protein